MLSFTCQRVRLRVVSRVCNGKCSGLSIITQQAQQKHFTVHVTTFHYKLQLTGVEVTLHTWETHFTVRKPLFRSLGVFYMQALNLETRGLNLGN